MKKVVVITIAIVVLSLAFLFSDASADTILIQDGFDSFLLWETVDGGWTVTGGGYSGNGLQPTTTGTNIIKRELPYVPPGTYQLSYKYNGPGVGHAIKLLDENGNMIYQPGGCNPIGGGWYDCFDASFNLAVAPASLQITANGTGWIFDDVFLAGLNMDWTGDCIDQANLLTNSHFDANYSGWEIMSGSASVINGELMLNGTIRQAVTIPDTVTTAWIVIHARAQGTNAAFYWALGDITGELEITDQTVVAEENLVYLGYEPPVIDFLMTTPDGIYVNDVWIVGLDTNQNPICDEPPPPIIGLEILPCYACPVPQTYDIGPWIVWLYCELQNLFYCALRIWLLEIVNVTAGLYGNVTAIISWLPAAALETLNWSAGGVNMAIDRQIDMYNSFKDYLEAISLIIVVGSTNSESESSSWLDWLLDAFAFLVDGFAFIWDLFWLVWNGFGVLWTLIIELVSFVVSGVFIAIRQMFEMFIGLIDVIWQAFEAEAYQLDFLFEEGVPPTYEAYQAELYTAGSETQTYTALMWGMSLMDSWIVESGFSGWESVLIGLVALPTFLWIMREWSTLIPDI